MASFLVGLLEKKPLPIEADTNLGNLRFKQSKNHLETLNKKNEVLSQVYVFHLRNIQTPQ